MRPDDSEARPSMPLYNIISSQALYGIHIEYAAKYTTPPYLLCNPEPICG